MFALNQNKNTLVNIDTTTFVQLGYAEDTRKHRIIAHIGYLLKPNGTPSPIVEILGEYEDESDANVAFQKFTYSLKCKAVYFEMPPDDVV